MLAKFIRENLIILAIIFSTALLRLYQIDYPKGYVFDEVYHAFTAKEYLGGSREAWEWWTTPPPGVAYEWTHPPIAKEIMTLSMFLTRSDEAWAWRLPGVFFGVLSVFLVYLIAVRVFQHKTPALLSSFLFSLDGLNFVQSRTGMNDIYFVTFMLISLLFFLRKQLFISAIFLGITLASKWTGIYFLGFLLILLATQTTKSMKSYHGVLRSILRILMFPSVAALVYFSSYIPFFILGHSFSQFIELQQQMWWYHTGLKAIHDYTSPWWSWPLNLYPVWYFVEYHKNGAISNIFASGNPILFWLGSGAIIVALWDLIIRRLRILIIPIIGFLVFWLPWAFSPRIMFLYHFSPSVPFMCMMLGYWLYQLKGEKNYKLILSILLGLIVISFMLLYPILVGIPLPKDLTLWFFQTNLTKNPF